ncbi:MAG: DNA polymerase III subunit beta [Aestuariivita sp.]|nr:DNA polymerase III subunit beta [Aestuariivita sp.]MCY4201263.1 DNA polymerase III subunit beta [Aestuariivita sp.]
MKLSIERGILLRALSSAQAIVESRNVIPILSNLLFTANDDSVTIRTTDLQLDFTEVIPAEVKQKGSTTMPATMLSDIVRKLPDGGVVSFNADPKDGRMAIHCGRSDFSLPTFPDADFPDAQKVEYSANFSISASILNRLFVKSRFAMSTEETRYYLNGVCMHIAETDTGHVLRCIATDGHRLALVETEAPADAIDMPKVIIPRKAVHEIVRLSEDDDTTVAVSISDTVVRFATSSITLTSRTVEGVFPDYTKVIPDNNTRKLEVDAKDFARAIDRVSTVSSEKTRAVKLQIDQDQMVMSVNAPESGIGEEALAVAYSDEPMTIGFNARFLFDIASQVDKANATVMLNTPDDPTLIHEGDDQSAIYVVMPMRV